MIVFDLSCDQAHRFEGWFANSDAFDRQRCDGLIDCPYCGSRAIERAISVPRIASSTTSSNAPSKGEALARLAAMQQAVLKESTWVGGNFANRARAMAEGAEPPITIHGQTTIGEAKALHEDGIRVTPLPFPVVPPEQRN